MVQIFLLKGVYIMKVSFLTKKRRMETQITFTEIVSWWRYYRSYLPGHITVSISNGQITVILSEWNKSRHFQENFSQPMFYALQEIFSQKGYKVETEEGLPKELATTFKVYSRPP